MILLILICRLVGSCWVEWTIWRSKWNGGNWIALSLQITFLGDLDKYLISCCHAHTHTVGTFWMLIMKKRFKQNINESIYYFTKTHGGIILRILTDIFYILLNKICFLLQNISNFNFNFYKKLNMFLIFVFIKHDIVLVPNTKSRRFY